MKKLKTFLLVLASLISVILFAGCDDSSSSSGPEEVNTKPIANFTVSPESGTVATEFSFDASSSSDEEDEASSLKVRFDFDGDGNFDTDWTTEKIATHRYSQVGTYNAKLEVKDSGDLISEKVKTVTVSEISNTAPVANFTVSPESGTTEATFTFDASSSSDEEDEASSLKVRFDFDGDGNFDTDWTTEKIATHKYSQVGTYNAKLEVKDSGNLTSEKVKTVTVNEIPNTAPIADFSISPETGTTEATFTFDASSSSDEEDEVANLKVRFDFDGDGNFDTDWTTEKIATHKYSQVGTYNAKLEVKDSGNLTSEKVKTVTVNEIPNTAPIADFSISPETGTTETNFTFDASSSSDEEDEVANLKVRFDFDGDGNFDTDWTTEKTATHKYNSAGTYDAKLEVKDSGDLTSEKVKTVVVNDEGGELEMVTIPSGSFMMGDNKEEGQVFELPVHEVTINSFKISKYEITNAEYCKFLNSEGNQEEGGVYWIKLGQDWSQIEESNNVYQPKEGYANHPVIGVTWYGARAYCEWKGGRLPTEAEWEYAARGTLEGKRFPRGETISHSTNGDEQACYSAKPSDYSYDVSPTEGLYQGIYGAIEVGSFAANGYGLCDMSGNVWEWCNDWFSFDYYETSPSDNPQGPSDGDHRVLRGGSWGDLAIFCRVTYRDFCVPTFCNNFVGFRLVLPL